MVNYRFHTKCLKISSEYCGRISKRQEQAHTQMLMANGIYNDAYSIEIKKLSIKTVMKYHVGKHTKEC